MVNTVIWVSGTLRHGARRTLTSTAKFSLMKAWIAVKRGAPEQALQLRTDWPQPTSSNIGKGDVLVQVSAAALNPLGYKLLKMLPNFIAKRPAVPEFDIAGTVVDGNGTSFSTGDKVYGSVRPGEYVSTGAIHIYSPDTRAEVALKTKQGALAEYTYLPSKFLALKPENVSATEAAGLASTGLTGMGCIDKAGLQSGQTVLINGGSSAVGAFAIQVAKARGVRVVATASGKNEEFVRSLGADEFIDYTKEPLAQKLSKEPPSTKYHAIIDAVGLIDPSLYTRSAAYLAPGGEFITTGPMPKKLSDSGALFRTVFEAFLRPSWLGGTKRKYSVFALEATPEMFETFTNYVREGKIKPVVDSVYEFEDVLKAYERQMSGRTRGKVVVKVRD